MRAPVSPVEDAERLLRRYTAFRREGFDDLDAQALARSGVTHHAITLLLKRGCPKHLVARILT